MHMPSPTERGIYCGSRFLRAASAMMRSCAADLGGLDPGGQRLRFCGVNIALDPRLDTVGEEASAYVFPQDWVEGDHTLDLLISRIERYARFNEQYKSMQAQANAGAPTESEVLIGGGEARAGESLFAPYETIDDPDGLLG